MRDFFLALIDPSFPFLRMAMIAGLLAAPAFGIVGTYVVSNRLGSMAGAVSHAVLAGIGLALFLKGIDPDTWFSPTIGSLLSAVAAALVIARAGYGRKVPIETSVNLVWALGAAIGAVFLAFARGYSDPSAYLFGNILILSPANLWFLAAFDLLVVGLGLGLYPQWSSVSYDPEFARCRGVNVDLIRTVLLVLVGVAVVLLVDLVGVVLVIAMFSLPASLAASFTKTLKGGMAGATLAAAASVALGLFIAYLSDLPSGAAIVGVAALAYGLGAAVNRFRISFYRRNI